MAIIEKRFNRDIIALDVSATVEGRRPLLDVLEDVPAGKVASKRSNAVFPTAREP